MPTVFGGNVTILTPGWLHSGHRTQSGSPYPAILPSDVPAELVGGRTPDWHLDIRLQLRHHRLDCPRSQGRLLSEVDEGDDRSPRFAFSLYVFEYSASG